MSKYVGLVQGKVHDRRETSEYYCGGCGYPVTDHDSYCRECGGALHEGAERECKLVYGEDDDGVDGWYTQCGGWFAATRKDGRMVHPKFCQLCGGKAGKR